MSTRITYTTLPTIQLEDWLEKYRLKVIVAQIGPNSFKAAFDGDPKLIVANEQDGIAGYGPSHHAALEDFCNTLSGCKLAVEGERYDASRFVINPPDE